MPLEHVGRYCEREEVERLIALKPEMVLIQPTLYFLHFTDEPNLRFVTSVGWYADCWWNDRGCPYKGCININLTYDKLKEKIGSVRNA